MKHDAHPQPHPNDDLGDAVPELETNPAHIHFRGFDATHEPRTLAELEASVHVPASELTTSQTVEEVPDADLEWAERRRPYRLIGGA
jgi:hypothetical protein